MYEYFKATVTSITANYIVIECNDIGYQIKVPNPYVFKENEALTIYTHLIVKEDAQDLFGFKTILERDMFIRLINVKGLGPKGVLAIMAGAAPNDIIKALQASNASFFGKFPGIGPKTSQQIILDLKGKVNFTKTTSDGVTDEFTENVSSALKALGYSSSEVKKATNNLNKDLPLAQAVKEALKSLNTK